MFFYCTVSLSRLLGDTKMWGNFTLSQNCIFREFQTSCFQAVIQSRISENSIITLVTIGSYARSYIFKICFHNCLQNNGMTLFVVKILAVGYRRVMDSDVLCICTLNAIWKIGRILKSFAISLNISSVGEGICCACRAVHMAQVVYIFIHSYCSYCIPCNHFIIILSTYVFDSLKMYQTSIEPNWLYHETE